MFGNLLAGTPPQSSGIGQMLGQGQEQPSGGGIGDVLQGLQNPAVYMALLQAADKMFNPTSYSTGGQITQGMASGLGAYQAITQAEAEKKRQQEREDKADAREDRKLGQGDRGLDIESSRADNQAAYQSRSLDIQEAGQQQQNQQFYAGQGQQNQQFLDRMALEWARYGLDTNQQAMQRDLMNAQIAKYGAEAEHLKAKADKAQQGQSEHLTGQERIINQFAGILQEAGLESDAAYVKAFDMYSGAGADKAKTVSRYIENMKFLTATPEGQKRFEDGLRQLMEVDYQTAADVLKGAKGETSAPSSDTAVEKVLQDNGLNWDQLDPAARAKVLRAVEERFKAANVPFNPSKYK